MAKKEKVNVSVKNTIFNVKPIHVARIEAYLQAGYDKVIIHGDGAMFCGKTGQLFEGKTMEEGSDHHREFNSGVAEINKDELVARAKFRAIYKKGDELPKTVEDIIQEFYDNQAREMQASVKQDLSSGFKNAVTNPDPVEKPKKAEKESGEQT